jgi:hypothetical protein
MPLATAVIGIGKQVVTHAVCTWWGARREGAERDAELIDLVRLSVRDHFYADLRIMPMSGPKGLVVAVPAVVRSA